MLFHTDSVKIDSGNTKVAGRRVVGHPAALYEWKLAGSPSVEGASFTDVPAGADCEKKVNKNSRSFRSMSLN